MSLFNCTCLPDWYTRQGPGVQCQPCPSCAVCEGGLELPYAAVRCYPSEAEDVFLPCRGPAADACLGGKGDALCKREYTGRSCWRMWETLCNVFFLGRLCADCIPNYYQVNGICYKW